MGIYNVHAGHGNAGGLGSGAVGILNESIEDRKVKDALCNILRSNGHTVYDCTFNRNTSQGTILAEIVKKCNAHVVDYDISIHLNSGRNDRNGDNRTGGVEVLGYDDQVEKMANEICISISNALGITNRGFKIAKDLYVLNSTHSKAMLIECCFVDDKDDADRWNADKCADAISLALIGKTSVKAVNPHNSDKYQLAGESDKMYTFEAKNECTVKVAPNSNADVVTKLTKGSRQGITKVTTEMWGYLGNGAGWINLRDFKPVSTHVYKLDWSHTYVRVANLGSKIVADVKRGSVQPICFISKKGRGLISNYAGWVSLTHFRKL